MSKEKIIGKATLRYDEGELTLPIVEGSEGERAIDIRALRKETGLITLDPGYVNTGSCTSRITFVDGEKGILRYRGYDIEDLTENCTFREVAYLLVHEALPKKDELQRFSRLLNQHSMIHEDMRTFFRNYPEHAHPMAMLSAMVVSLSTFYPELQGEESQQEEIDITVTRLLSKLRTIAAFSYKKFSGEPFVYPRHDLSYCANFLHMMFHSPVRNYTINPVLVRALNQLLILHADHEQNCSTSVVRFIGSAHANLYASISAGICALWGDLHGGANQKVIEMLEQIQADGGDVAKAVSRAKDKNDPYRLMGFGHRVYKTYDPRARLAMKACQEILDVLALEDPLLNLAMELEEIALNDSYFQDRHLYPNVDFYTGISYRALGFPTNMFTVLFALGRLPGWIAQWQELMADTDQRIGRPRQIYTGPMRRDFVALEDR
jgi:citrate synthase